MPFYNVSKAVRVILFSTRNQREFIYSIPSPPTSNGSFSVGLNFGILIAWVVVSCITLPLFQWFMRRKHIDEVNKAFEPDEKVA